MRRRNTFRRSGKPVRQSRRQSLMIAASVHVTHLVAQTHLYRCGINVQVPSVRVKHVDFILLSNSSPEELVVGIDRGVQLDSPLRPAPPSAGLEPAAGLWGQRDVWPTARFPSVWGVRIGESLS